MKRLVIKLGALGDVVMATSLLQAIQQHHAGEDLFLLTAPGFAPLFSDWPGLRVKAFPRKGASLKTLRWIRAEKFDRIYDLQSSDRTGLFCALSGAKERVGNHPRFPYTHHPDDRFIGQCHIFERMNQVLASAGIPAAATQPHLPVNAEDRAHVDRWLNQHISQPVKPVLLHAGASPAWPSKRWQGYGSLAKALEKQDIPVIWIGAGDDTEINKTLSQQAGTDATGCFTFNQLAELGRRARCAIVNDSGPMHILSAAGIPVFGFFGPTSWRRNHALGQEDRVLSAELECSPCSLGDCPPARDHQCMKQLSVEMLLQRLRQEQLI